VKIPLSNKFKIIVTLAVFISLGALFGRVTTEFWPAIKHQLFSPAHVYMTSDEILIDKYARAQVQALDWASLLPEKEYEIIARYQTKKGQNLDDMTSQILRSINASTDKSYQDALISTNTVNLLKNQIIAISGFIVPIDFHQDKSVKNIFFVPYFGACLHFPAPPPNQMIFARLEEGFNNLDITQPYTVTGEINLDLFEDLMGTSAYSIEVVSITPYQEQPDDFRRH
jgi:hypothetical protein